MYQHLLDRSTPHVAVRWVVWLLVTAMYFIRAFILQANTLFLIATEIVNYVVLLISCGLLIQYSLSLRSTFFATCLEYNMDSVYVCELCTSCILYNVNYVFGSALLIVHKPVIVSYMIIIRYRKFLTESNKFGFSNFL